MNPGRQAQQSSILDALAVLGVDEPTCKLLLREFKVCPGNNVDMILALAAEAGKLHVMGERVHRLTRISQRGAPAWRVDGPQGPMAKLRVSSTREMPIRVAMFLEHAARTDWKHCARLIRHQGTALLKTWIVARPFLGMSAVQREEVIGSIGSALGALHGSSTTCHLICGADRYNTVIRDDGSPAFVDLECCAHGSRWIDIAWSEDLLCDSEEQVKSLRNGYAKTSCCSPPSDAERKRSRTAYLQWLLFSLRDAGRRFPEDQSISEDISRAEQEIRRAGAAPVC